ncbi:MAG: ATP-binding protein [Flavisolibacter sp.]|nr:ATP-binding protein [Flavisolibacter sp.]
MRQFLENAANQNHPLRVLSDFLNNEESIEKAKRYHESRFVGYVLEIGYDEITIITCDPFKVNVGGIPRNSLLIMVPDSFEQSGTSIPPHFTLLRVLDSAPTPLSKEVQQTYFELQKKSMPELDIFTQSELQWGALRTKVLGMFYPHPTQPDTIEFSGDLNNYVSAHKYKVFSPDDALLFLVNNATVPNENRFAIGKLRLTECRLPLPNKQMPNVDIFLSTNDFKGTRTAMFGKTRLGKSNVVKLIVQSILETTRENRNVGQLIFDINGEYANDNPQDDNLSIRGAYPDRCTVYAVTPKQNTPSLPLRLNFYTNPNNSIRVLRGLLQEAGFTSGYINTFSSVELPTIEEVNQLEFGSEKNRAIRLIQYYWAVLRKAGFRANENELSNVLRNQQNGPRGFSPHFNRDIRNAVYNNNPPPHPTNLQELVTELETIIRFQRANSTNPTVTGNNNLFDQDDLAILNFLEPRQGSGTTLIQSFRLYHDANAGNFVEDILRLLDQGQTVILDLGNANEEVMQYFSRQLSNAVFAHQTTKFTNNTLGNNYVQLYFEEAHNLFGNNDESDDTKIYRRFAKEGAKYHIGMVYSTQSPSTVNSDLLAQTENFFIAHLASQDDTNKLAKVNMAYDSIKNDILNAKTPGYMRMLTRSHRFVVSMQANRFTPPNNNSNAISTRDRQPATA